MSAGLRLFDSLRSRDTVRAAGELLLIVAGILIALAIDGWVADRNERRLERESLQLLRADLGQTLEQIDEFRDFQASVLEASGTAYRQLVRPPDRIARDTAWVAIRTLLSRRTLKLPRAAYQELLGTGHLRLIRDGSLRSEIVRFYEELGRDESVVAQNNESFTDEMFDAFFVGDGLVLPYPPEPDETQRSTLSVQNRTTSGALSMSAYLEAIGPISGAREGRLWSLPAGAPEWTRARSHALWSAQASAVALALSERIQERVVALRDRVSAELDETGG